MGFFSSIVRFVKNVVSAVLSAIARFMNSVFGSPIVAALVLFLVTWWFAGPLAFQMLWANPVAYIATAEGYFFTMMLGNLITTLATAISPQLGKAIGFAVGLVSFVMMGMNIQSLYTNGTWNGAAVFSKLCSSVGVETAKASLETMFSLVSGYTITALATSLAAGVNSDGSFKSSYAQAYINGFFAPAELVAEGVDSAVSAATSSIGNILLLVGGAYLAYRWNAGSNQRRADEIASKRDELELRRLNVELKGTA